MFLLVQDIDMDGSTFSERLADAMREAGITAVESFDSGAATACAAQLPNCPPELLAFLEGRYPHLWRLLRTEMTGNHELPGF